MSNELNIEEAAAFVGIGEKSFRRLCAAGNGPNCRRDGRAKYFLPDTLTAWKNDPVNGPYSQSSAKQVKKAKKAVKKAA